MNCKNCMAPLSSEDTYCKVCGTPVEKEELKSNEEVIASYNEEKEEKILPSEQTIEEIKEIEPVQVLNEEVKVQKEAPVPIINNEGISKKIYVLSILIAAIATFIIVSLIFIPITSSKVEKAKGEVQKETVEKIVKENRILFGNYSFMYKEGFSYKLVGDQLLIQKNDTNQAVSIQLANQSYASLKENLNVLKTNLTKLKWVVGKISLDTTVNDKVYLTVEATTNKQNVMIAYTMASETETFGMVYYDPNMTVGYPEDSIKVFNEIIASAQKEQNTFTSKIATYSVNKLFVTAPTTTKTTN